MEERRELCLGCQRHFCNDGLRIHHAKNRACARRANRQQAQPSVVRQQAVAHQPGASSQGGEGTSAGTPPPPPLPAVAAGADWRDPASWQAAEQTPSLLLPRPSERAVQLTASAQRAGVLGGFPQLLPTGAAATNSIATKRQRLDLSLSHKSCCVECAACTENSSTGLCALHALSTAVSLAHELQGVWLSGALHAAVKCSPWLGAEPALQQRRNRAIC